MSHPRFTAGAEAAYVASMANGRAPYRPCHSIPALVPAGLSGAEAAAVEAGLGAVPGAWCAVPYTDEAGEVSVMVMASDPADEVAPSYVVHREGALLRLDVCRGETYARLGAYAAVAPLLRALAALAGAPPER